MTPRYGILGYSFACVLILNGCNHCCKRQPCPSGCPSGPSGPAPYAATPHLPPQNIPIDPTPGSSSRSAPEILLPTTPPSANGNARSGGSPSAKKPGAYLLDPDLSQAAAVEEGKTPPERPATSPERQAMPPGKQPPPPPIVEEGGSSPFPVGIANFSEVKDGVSAGFRPYPLDGFNWLQTKGYKTVVYLRDGTEDDSSDRKQAENRGLKYVSLIVTPDKINSDLVSEFNRIVNDPAGRPIFVYDVNGSRAGAMWYLYFRASELLSNDEALLRARRHGLKEKGSDEQTQLMTAVQKYLSSQKQ